MKVNQQSNKLSRAEEKALIKQQIANQRSRAAAGHGIVDTRNAGSQILTVILLVGGISLISFASVQNKSEKASREIRAQVLTECIMSGGTYVSCNQ